MTQKSGKLIAGVGAAVAGLAVFLARQLDLFADDAARVIPPPPVVSGAGDVLQDPGVQSSLKTAVSSYRALRQGAPEETVVANVGCQIMNTDLANSLTQDGYEQQIRRELPLEYQSGPESFIIDRYVDRAANALAVANEHGGAARWYVQYCVIKP